MGLSEQGSICRVADVHVLIISGILMNWMVLLV